jgi:molybdenum cofactor biosynthesis enzyme MoaA
MEKYLSPEQVCDIVPGMTRGGLATLRFTGKGPKFRKPTPKTVVYLESEVVAWVEGSAQSQTGSPASA